MGVGDRQHPSEVLPHRMDYGFWLLLFGDTGHTEAFRGAFDRFMDVAFYLPNLAVVQLYLRGRIATASTRSQRVAAAALVAATGFLLLGTYFFTTEIWAPAMLRRWPANQAHPSAPLIAAVSLWQVPHAATRGAGEPPWV